MPERERRITVLLTGFEFDRFEAYCLEKGHHKSTLIARLVRDHLDAEKWQMTRASTPPRRELK